ncbi:TPA: hypothetical protein R4S04_000728 [Enterobacter bugandensis]|uniref:hypothetical protein n=1 Tax=Enterobacter TaxID=547 RepID=UPI00186668E2|nr:MULTISPECIES: hypothetical protein [Enterobacter]MBE3483448.1 hypothetical protein [Enterobacter cloacae complex sp. P14RS]MCK7409828.1 hypothetical protein [Enterobacter bugandensis]HED1242907.1 hypothetical protein [Enterobacter bugandensis]
MHTKKPHPKLGKQQLLEAVARVVAQRKMEGSAAKRVRVERFKERSVVTVDAKGNYHLVYMALNGEVLAKHLLEVDACVHAYKAKKFDCKDVKFAFPANQRVTINVPKLSHAEASELSMRMISRSLDEMQEELYDDAE